MNRDEEQLRRLDREWNEAYPRRDVEALGRILADDWTAIDWAGLIVSRRQLLERVASHPAQFNRHEFDEFTLRVFSDAALVTGRLSGSGRDEEGGGSACGSVSRASTRRGAARGRPWRRR